MALASYCHSGYGFRAFLEQGSLDVSHGGCSTHLFQKVEHSDENRLLLEGALQRIRVWIEDFSGAML